MLYTYNNYSTLGKDGSLRIPEIAYYIHIRVKKPNNFERTVYVKKNLSRRSIGALFKHPESAFQTVHEGFVNLELGLQTVAHFMHKYFVTNLT